MRVVKDGKTVGFIDDLKERNQSAERYRAVTMKGDIHLFATLLEAQCFLIWEAAW
jgi:hypothetical protein